MIVLQWYGRTISVVWMNNDRVERMNDDRGAVVPTDPYGFFLIENLNEIVPKSRYQCGLWQEPH